MIKIIQCTMRFVIIDHDFDVLYMWSFCLLITSSHHCRAGREIVLGAVTAVCNEVCL